MGRNGYKCLSLPSSLDNMASSHLGHGGLDAGGVVGAGAGGAVDEPWLGLLVAAHQAVVRARRLVDALVAVPAARDQCLKWWQLVGVE